MKKRFESPPYWIWLAYTNRFSVPFAIGYALAHDNDPTWARLLAYGCALFAIMLWLAAGSTEWRHVDKFWRES